MYTKFIDSVDHLIKINTTLSEAEKGFAKIVLGQVSKTDIKAKAIECPYENPEDMRRDAAFNIGVRMVNRQNIQAFTAKALKDTPTFDANMLSSKFMPTCIDIYVEALTMTIFDENGNKVLTMAENPEKTFDGFIQVANNQINNNERLTLHQKEFMKKVFLQFDTDGIEKMVNLPCYDSADELRKAGYRVDIYAINKHTITTCVSDVVNTDPEYAHLPDPEFIKIGIDILINSLADYAFNEINEEEN